MINRFLLKSSHGKPTSFSSLPSSLPSFLCLVSPTPPDPGNHKSTFCLYGFACSDISYKWNHAICGILCLPSFTYHDVFKIHSCCSINQYFVPFLCLSNIPLYVHTYSIWCIHSSVNGHMDHSHFLTVWIRVCECAQVFVWTYVFSSFGYVHRSGIAGSWGNCWAFWEVNKLFSRLQCGCTILHYCS